MNLGVPHFPVVWHNIGVLQVEVKPDRTLLYFRVVPEVGALPILWTKSSVR